MKITGLVAGVLIATATASEQTTDDLPLPSAKAYFQSAAEAQVCNGGEPAKLPELEALRTQALGYYRTKLSKADAGSDPASASAVLALDANVVPPDALATALAMKRIAADWAGWCRGMPSAIRHAHARHDLALATIGWPGAMPLDQAQKALAALDGQAVRVSTLRASPPPLSATADSATPPIVCKSGAVDVLVGIQADAGSRFTTATGLTVTTPTRSGPWTVARCNSGGVALVHRDPATQGLLVGMATDVGIAPWTDEKTFEEQVRRIVEQSTTAGVHLKIDGMKAVTIDGRPCVDVRRSGSVDFLLAPDGRRLAGPFDSRDFLRACHLRDRRGLDASTLMAVSGNGLRDMASFDDAARSFGDGVTLPPWMH